MTVAGADVQRASNGTCDAQKWCIKITAINEKGWNNASRCGVCAREYCAGATVVMAKCAEASETTTCDSVAMNTCWKFADTDVSVCACVCVCA